MTVKKTLIILLIISIIFCITGCKYNQPVEVTTDIRDYIVNGESLSKAGYLIDDLASLINFNDPNSPNEVTNFEIMNVENDSITLSDKHQNISGSYTFVCATPFVANRVDVTYVPLFVLQCYNKNDIKDGSAIIVNNNIVPLSELLDNLIYEDDNYVIYDIREASDNLTISEFLTDFANSQNTPDKYIMWLESIYTRVKEQLSAQIQPS